MKLMLTKSRDLAPQIRRINFMDINSSGSFGGLTPIDSLDSPFGGSVKSPMASSPESPRSPDSMCQSEDSMQTTAMNFEDQSDM